MSKNLENVPVVFPLFIGFHTSQVFFSPSFGAFPSLQPDLHFPAGASLATGSPIPVLIRPKDLKPRITVSHAVKWTKFIYCSGILFKDKPPRILMTYNKSTWTCQELTVLSLTSWKLYFVMYHCARFNVVISVETPLWKKCGKMMWNAITDPAKPATSKTWSPFQLKRERASFWTNNPWTNQPSDISSLSL